MFWLVLMLIAPLQSTAPTCLGSNDTVDCRSADGSTYVERRIGDQVVRQGTDPDGNSWTEYVTPVFDGTRTNGSDSSGRTWTQQCNPRFGTTGTDRDGKSIFIPPPPRQAAASQDDDRNGAISNPVGKQQPTTTCL